MTELTTDMWDEILNEVCMENYHRPDMTNTMLEQCFNKKLQERYGVTVEFLPPGILRQARHGEETRH